jgi:hypothetical protein
MVYTQTPPVAPTMAGTVVTYSAVPAGGLAVLPGSILLVTNSNNGYILVDFSSVTTVTAAVINVPQ